MISFCHEADTGAELLRRGCRRRTVTRRPTVNSPAGGSSSPNRRKRWALFEPSLRQQLLRTGGLPLRDGLDGSPKPTSAGCRSGCGGAVCRRLPEAPCAGHELTNAYQRQDWKLHGSAEAVLAPSAAQMDCFVERWYAYAGQARRLSPDDTQGRVTLLEQAIGRTPRLYELAHPSALLTLLASLYAWRGGTLPEQREALYADAVDLLHDQWESQN